MCAKYDYVDWDDLDLDSLLIEYTDNDCYTDSDFDTSSDFDSVAIGADSKPVAKVVKRSAVKREFQYLYVCPACRKEYKSPSGLRGHVLKQHKDTHGAGHCKGECEAYNCIPVVAIASNLSVY